MSLRSAPGRHLGVPAVGLAAALLLAGCGSGQDPQTYQEKAASDATNTSVGAIAVRNLAVQGPLQGTVLRQGTDARVTVTLVNDGADNDALVSASSPAASSVEIVGPTSSLQVAPGSTTGTAYSLLLMSLSRDLPTGTFISLTLNFQHNGTKTMLVPVQVTPEGLPRPTGTYEIPETDSANQPIVSGQGAG